MDAGETFRRPGGGHLWIVISEPQQNRQCIAVVNITSVRKNVRYDSSCILHVGDHPFIQHESYVLYQESRVESDRALEKKVAGGGYNIEGCVTEEILGLIREGAFISEDTPIRVLQILKDQGFA